MLFRCNWCIRDYYKNKPTPTATTTAIHSVKPKPTIDDKIKPENNVGDEIVPRKNLDNVQLRSINCGEYAFFEGRHGVYHFNVNLGPGVGPVEFEYNAVNISDRFIVELGGEVKVDTGFVGNPKYDQKLISAGYGPVTGWNGTTSFKKNPKDLPIAKITVVAPFKGTKWKCYMDCSDLTTEEDFDEEYDYHEYTNSEELGDEED